MSKLPSLASALAILAALGGCAARGPAGSQAERADPALTAPAHIAGRADSGGVVAGAGGGMTAGTSTAGGRGAHP